jgi:hypoxanthine phosphoribosyltransferase|tara:strand:- start:3324 stop:3899 length:576 start_codon:yes stop_codon:yes gene_type:complete
VDKKTMDNSRNMNFITNLWEEHEINESIKKLASKINSDYEHINIVNLVPVLTGALFFSAKLISELEFLSPGKWKVIPIMSSSYFNSYESTEPDIIMVRDFEKRLDIDSPCLIIDDILDSGLTIHRIKELLNGLTNQTTSVVVMVDKTIKRAVDITPDYYGFRLEKDLWLVGFGMDDKGLYRGLRYIGYVTV